MMNNLIRELTGITQEHLGKSQKLDTYVHKEIIPDLEALYDHLHKQGFKLRIISGFRSFDQQKKIWEDKIKGRKPILDDHEVPIDLSSLDNHKLLFAILNWSMIPGFSRHHFGTELDVIDENSLPKGYRVQLTNDECIGSGPFSLFHTYLDTLIENNQAYGFYRPYTKYNGGVRPEKWHLSHKKTAEKYLKILDEKLFKELLIQLEIPLSHDILANSNEIFKKYII